MLLALLSLLLTAPPACAQTARVELRPVSAVSGPSAPLSGLRAQGISLSLAPSLAAPSLKATLSAAVPAVVPGVQSVQPVTVMGGLEGWHEESSRQSAPDAAALGKLWDRSSSKVSAAPVDLAPAVPDGVGAAALVKAAPEQSGSFEAIPGSVFDWKPVEASPNHGFGLLDRVIRWALGRKDGRFGGGYEMKRGEPGVFFYGERHTDKALIKENMRRIAANLGEGKGALILDEGYFGPRLYGTAALEYLEKKGFEEEWLGEGRWASSGLEVTGWDDREIYDRSKHPLLQQHMNLLDINHLLYSDERGLRYYRELASKAWETFKNWRILRKLAITDRNAVLDRRVAEALSETAQSGKSLHVIAGGEHLVERPMLMGVPLIGRPQMRRGLREALGGRGYWAGMPAESDRK